ncbi:MAG: sigma 54-interacting transcriptional regulator [Acidobacteriia bacterium]|nr:sigma 54-interacting transcriptional regulator [Terriglobia bacterium]
MNVRIFTLDGAHREHVARWSAGLRALDSGIHLEVSADLALAARALWLGEPFVVAGSPTALNHYFDSFESSALTILEDCAYCWVLTNLPKYRHPRIPRDRVVALNWNADEQNVVYERLQVLKIFSRLAGLSRHMHHLRQEIMRIAEGRKGPWSPVLILGATGSGKEEVAQALFKVSERGNRPTDMQCISGSWLNVDPGLGLSEILGIEPGVASQVHGRPGLVELFSEGALFVDDFETAPKSVQETLLRIISTPKNQPAPYRRIGGREDRTTNVWLLFATNANVDQLLQDDRLREDFMYRFEDRVLIVPPLQKRPADFPAIARWIWRQLWDVPEEKALPVPLGSDALRQLSTCNLAWEGNVRTLRAFLALVVSMKKLPIHNQHALSTLFNIILQRGKTYKEWVGIVASDVFTGGPHSAISPLAEDICAAPCESEARLFLTQPGWEQLEKVVARLSGRKPFSRDGIRRRLAQIICYVEQMPSIEIADAQALSQMSNTQARNDLRALCATGLLRKATKDSSRNNARAIYVKNEHFFVSTRNT